MSRFNVTPLQRYSSHDCFAYKKGKPICFASFLFDVQRFADDICDKKGDVWIDCTGRYAFSVALVGAWVANKVAVLCSDKTLLTEEIACCCNQSWAKELEKKEGCYDGRCNLSFSVNDVAVRLYTSGSTGAAKAIDKTFGNIWLEVEGIKNIWTWDGSPIVASVPAYHLYGLTFSVLLPWCLGVSMVDETPLHAEEVALCFQQTQATTLVTVPIHLKAMMQASVKLGNKRCIVSAAALPYDTAVLFQRTYRADVLEVYGSSETGVIAHRKQLQDECWQCFSEVEVGENSDGLLQITSPFVFPQGIKPSTKNTFLSADKVQLKSSKLFVLEGRVDDIVKIAGKRISLVNIEQNLMRCEQVLDATVIAVPAESEIRDWSVWAIIAVQDLEKTSVQNIKKALRAYVEAVAIPRRIVKVTKLPRQANGKIPKKAVMDIFNNV